MGYSTLGVTFQARYNGSRDRATGPLLLVLWENLTDPILTGREQLGFSKIYCELPEPVIHGGETHCTASWLGFRFMDMRLTNMVEVEAPAVAAAAPPDDGLLNGTLHYKYVPRTGEWGEADAEYAVLSPANPPVTTPIQWQGDGCGAVSPGAVGGPADAVHDRERAARAGGKGMPGRDDHARRGRQGSNRPAHSAVSAVGIGREVA